MNPFILCPGGPNGSSDAQIELKEQIFSETRRGVQCACEREVLTRMAADARGLRRENVHLRRSFQGARRALADAPEPHILLEACGQPR